MRTECCYPSPQAQHGLQKIDVRARVGLTRQAHDGPVIATDFAPVVDLSAVHVGDLLQGQFVDRIFRIYDDGDGIAGDDEFNRVHAIGLRFVDLF